MTHFPVKIRLETGEERIIVRSTDLPQGTPFKVIELQVGKTEKPGIRIDPAY